MQKKFKIQKIHPQTIKNKLSTRKAANICRSHANSGIRIESPLQYVVWKAVMAKAMKMETLIDEKNKINGFCLHFDGKKINNVEYQIVCLQIKLDVVSCSDSTANSICIAIKSLLDKYNV